MREHINLLIAAVLLAVVSCAGSVSEEDKVRSLVGRYNSALVTAYKEGDFDRLVKVADGEALSKVDNAYQSYLKGPGIVLDAELLGLKFKEFSLGTGEDESGINVEWHEDEKEWREVYLYKETFVETEERWNYRWVDYRTGETASPVVTARYGVAYTVDRVDGALKVVSAKITSEEVEKEKGAWKEGKDPVAVGH
ncbi:MAG: hypothetical protein V3W31_04440 [Thermodesulfobacteriota bacterium]